MQVARALPFAADAAPAAGDDADAAANPVLDRYGVPRFHRRLSDKILAAFNHAYAGADDALAGALRGALEAAERREREALERRGRGALAPYCRRASSALHQAGLWQAHVDARRAYAALTIRADAAPERVAAASGAMSLAYARWALS